MRFQLSLMIWGLTCAIADSETASTSWAQLQKEHDVCSRGSNHEKSTRINLPNLGDYLDIYVRWPYHSGSKTFDACVTRFTTCNHCHIRVVAVDPYFSYKFCNISEQRDGICVPGCVYFSLVDADYPKEQWMIVSSSNKGEEVIFESTSKRLIVYACGSQADQANSSMRLRLISVEKRMLVTQDTASVKSVTFMSPYFPTFYGRNDDDYIYVIEPIASGNYMAITFNDWFLAPNSTIQFQGANIVNKITGTNIRPYIISYQHSLTMIFSTGQKGLFDAGRSYRGFTAQANFYTSPDDIPEIETDCDQSITNSKGGNIHLKIDADGRNRDCIWIIKLMDGFDGVSLKVLRYKLSRGRTDKVENSLTVRDGLTSSANNVLTLYRNDNNPISTLMVSDSGFYIRLKGKFYWDDSVLISFAMHDYSCDYSDDLYKCDNELCIATHLKCDGFDHCGDNSDELPSMCGRTPSKFRPAYGEIRNNVSSGNYHKYDYTIGIHVIIPLVVSIVIVIGITCLLIVFIRRCRRLGNATYGRRIAGPHEGRHCIVRLSATMRAIEHPPTYDEVIQNTPVGQMNMAFSVSTCDNGFTQPPSYEEAITPTSAAGQHPDSNSGDIPHLDSSTGRPRWNSVLSATIPTTLDSRADAQLSTGSPNNTSTRHLNSDSLSSSRRSDKDDCLPVFNSNFVPSPDTNKHKTGSGNAANSPRNTPTLGSRLSAVLNSLKPNREAGSHLNQEDKSHRHPGSSLGTPNSPRDRNRIILDGKDLGVINTSEAKRLAQNPLATNSFDQSQVQVNKNSDPKPHDEIRSEGFTGNEKGSEGIHPEHRKHHHEVTPINFEHTRDDSLCQLSGSLNDKSSGTLEQTGEHSVGAGRYALKDNIEAESEEENNGYSLAMFSDEYLTNPSDSSFSVYGLAGRKEPKKLSQYTDQGRDHAEDGYSARMHRNRQYEAEGTEDSEVFLDSQPHNNTSQA